MDRFDELLGRPRPVVLECGVQHYDWGQRGESAVIASLLGVPAGQEPWAELWIGAHPVKPSHIRLGGAAVPLTELIAAAPEAVLGPAVARRHGARLPFLLKVLAAERMLSIQAHPNKAQAQEGFAREEAAGIPRSADHRSYRDDSHKPELLVATGEFFALCGFRPLTEAVAAVARHPELAALLDGAGGTSATLRSLFETCMTMDRGALDGAVGRLVARLAAEGRSRPWARESHEHWLLRADRQFTRDGRYDPGLVVMLLLNLVRLAPGQGLFLAAGEPHSYLEGVGIELMASSDNVLRGGLTSKHVDVGELGRVLTFRGGPARPLDPDRDGVYRTPAEEFELSVVGLRAGESWASPPGAGGAELLLVTEGRVTLRSSADPQRLERGASVLVPAALPGYEIEAADAARVFRARSPA